MEDKNLILKVIIPTRQETDEIKSWVENLKDSAEYPNMIINLVVNPDGVSLTQVYNNFFTKDPNNSDIILFLHDDVEFLKKGWARELVSLFKNNPEYGIIGVAGSKQFDEKGAWWNYEKKYGQVLHRKDGKSWLTAFSPLLSEDLVEVAVIDGLFMAVYKDRVSKLFDNEIQGFNFYDIDFCLANYLDGKTKIGVTTKIRIAHNSIGELKQNWYDNKVKIVEKYKDFLPIDIDKDDKRGNR